MKLEASVTEVVELFNEIQQAPEKLFEMMRLDIRQIAGEYLTSLMEAELTIHLGRDRYDRCRIEVNHRNGSYPRRFTLKGIGEVAVKIPRDRKNTFQTSVLPQRKQFEEAVARDLSMMFLMGMGSGPHCMDSLMVKISSEPIGLWRHQAASVSG